MIPYFHDGLNLPAGLHQATMQEVAEHFGKTAKRIQLCASLQRVLNIGKDCKFRKVILFGSFVSSKESPGDIDLFWTLAPGTDTDTLKIHCRELLDAPNSKQRFQCDVFWCFDEDDAIRRMAEMWQLDRSGRKRGLVVIDLS
jgi:hypothetical protein